MPAKSKSQQRLMGMVHAYKKGELKSSEMPAGLRKKVKKIAGGMKDKSAKEFAKTKHKGLPEKVKENAKPTFKEFLVEITQKERQMLVPPPAIQKLYAQIKKKHGIVKRDVFFNALADRLNLSPAGMKQLMQKPALRALPFDDQSQDDKPLVAPRDPWAHVTQKFAKREQRAKRAGVMEAQQEPIFHWEIFDLYWTGHEPHLKAYYDGKRDDFEPMWDEATQTLVYSVYVTDEADFRENLPMLRDEEDEDFDAAGGEQLYLELIGTTRQINNFLKKYHKGQAREKHKIQKLSRKEYNNLFAD